MWRYCPFGSLLRMVGGFQILCLLLSIKAKRSPRTGGHTPRRPLLKITEAQPSATRILDAIESTKRELLMPGMVHSVRYLRLLPVVLFDWFADAFGINKAMKTFRGRR